MSERVVRVEGQSWNVFEAGSGPAMVFLHNGGGNLWNWAYQLEHFSPTRRVIAPDLPGFGRSHRPAQPLTLDLYVRGLERLLEALDCPRPVLVGNCIGASVALELALRQPGRVAALALFNLCGGPPMLSPLLRFWAALRPRTAPGRALHRYLTDAASHPLLGPLSAPLLYGQGRPGLPPGLERFALEQRRDPRLRAALSGLVGGLESYAVFSRPRRRPPGFPPVLLGWGEQNRTLGVRWAGAVAGWLEPDVLWRIENCGHLPMYEQPRRFNERLEGFLAAQARPAG